jgi:hypothetical protein
MSPPSNVSCLEFYPTLASPNSTRNNDCRRLRTRHHGIPKTARMTPHLRHTFVPLLLLATTASLGCAHDRPARSPAAAPPPTTRPHTPPPIRYADYGHPSRLTPAQLAELTTLADDVRPAGRDVWFILVLYNDAALNDPPAYTAVIYFTPDTTTPRLRSGQCSFIDATVPVATRRAIIKRIDPSDHYPRLSPYVQVSPADAPFNPTDRAIPANADLPFPRPDHIADAELVSIVDAARQVDRTRQPILRIDGDGPFAVTFGWQVGGLNGGGTIVTVRRTPSGYQADSSVTHWVS